MDSLDQLSIRYDSVNGGTEIEFDGNTILLVGVQAISQFDLLI